jgi:CRP/FNR family transcriptional regulator
MTESFTGVAQALRACGLLREASDEAIGQLAGSAVTQSAQRGGLLATEGEPADRFGVVMSGKVRVYHLGIDGRETTVDTLAAGDSFATAPTLAGGRHPAMIAAATACTVAWVSRAALYALLEKEPQVARSLLADLASHVIRLTTVTRTLSLDVPERLAHYLFQRSLEVGEATAEGLRVTLGMTKAELASALGTVPETLSRALGKLRDAGILTVRGSDVIVHDVGALARLGSGWND